MLGYTYFACAVNFPDANACSSHPPFPVIFGTTYEDLYFIRFSPSFWFWVPLLSLSAPTLYSE